MLLLQCVVGSVRYQVLNGAGLFTLNTVSGQLLTNGQLDHDTVSSYLLTIRAELLIDSSLYTLTQVTHLSWLLLLPVILIFSVDIPWTDAIFTWCSYILTCWLFPPAILWICDWKIMRLTPSRAVASLRRGLGLVIAPVCLCNHSPHSKIWCWQRWEGNLVSLVSNKQPFMDCELSWQLLYLREFFLGNVWRGIFFGDVWEMFGFVWGTFSGEEVNFFAGKCPGECLGWMSRFPCRITSLYI